MPPRKSRFNKRRNYRNKKKPAAGKKRTFSRVRRQSKRITTAAYVHRPLSNNGLPNVLTTKLKYTSAFTLTTAAVGALTSYAWNLNDLFDPDRTGVGHQPYLFDQIKVLYTNYLVYGCYVAIKLSPIAYNQNLVLTGIRLNNSISSPPTSWDYLKEIGHTAFISIVAGAPTKMYRRYISISKAIGVDFSSYLTDPDYKTAMGSSPSTIPTLSLSYSSGDGVSQPSFYVELTMVFYTKFSQLITAAQS